MRPTQEFLHSPNNCIVYSTKDVKESLTYFGLDVQPKVKQTGEKMFLRRP